MGVTEKKKMWTRVSICCEKRMDGSQASNAAAYRRCTNLRARLVPDSSFGEAFLDLDTKAFLAADLAALSTAAPVFLAGVLAALFFVAAILERGYLGAEYVN